jgi:hypothetical protein
VVVANPRDNDYASSMHGIPMTDEAFEQFIGLESPYRYETLILCAVITNSPAERLTLLPKVAHPENV